MIGKLELALHSMVDLMQNGAMRGIDHHRGAIEADAARIPDQGRDHQYVAREGHDHAQGPGLVPHINRGEADLPINAGEVDQALLVDQAAPLDTDDT